MARAFHPHDTLPVWSGYAGYFSHLDANPPSVNVGVLVGVYAAFLRPLIFEVLNYPILWEWLLAACIVVGFGLLTRRANQQIAPCGQPRLPVGRACNQNVAYPRTGGGNDSP